MEWLFSWVAMILVIYGFVVLLLLLSVRADRRRVSARFARVERAAGVESVTGP